MSLHRTTTEKKRKKAITIIKLAKMFVHQWAHLRYGVFDEHGNSSENLLYFLFYQLEEVNRNHQSNQET